MIINNIRMIRPGTLKPLNLTKELECGTVVKYRFESSTETENMWVELSERLEDKPHDCGSIHYIGLVLNSPINKDLDNLIEDEGNLYALICLRNILEVQNHSSN